MVSYRGNPPRCEKSDARECHCPACLTALTAGETAPTDAELLARHLAGDQGAFSDLVRRHGPMVLAACRRVLGHSADAEDAFQTTFAALARHAATIRGPAALPAWLHRTAIRAANRARSRRAATAPLPADPTDPVDPLADVAWRDLRCVLDRGARPTARRSIAAPVLLCLLGGMTRDEAAERIGYSLNTLKRRLEEGRALLRDRLIRRGCLAPRPGRGRTGFGWPARPGAGAVDRSRRALRSAGLGVRCESGCGGRAGAGLRWLHASRSAWAALRAHRSPSTATPANPPSAKAGTLELRMRGSMRRATRFPPGRRSGSARTAIEMVESTNQAILSPDGKVCATASEAGIMLFDLATGRRTHWITDSGVPNGDCAQLLPVRVRARRQEALHFVRSLLSRRSGVPGPARSPPTNCRPARSCDSFKPVPAPTPNRASLRSGYTRLWYPTGSKHLVANRDEITVFIEPDTGEEVRTLEFETNAAENTPDGLRLFVDPKRDNGVAVHDEEGKLVRTLDHTDEPTLLGFDSTGSVLAAVGKKAQVRVWESGEWQGTRRGGGSGEGGRGLFHHIARNYAGQEDRSRGHTSRE